MRISRVENDPSRSHRLAALMAATGRLKTDPGERPGNRDRELSERRTRAA
jgi:hypothetical protein